MTSERWLTACHEAGHAVATLMRGGGTFVSVTIEPTDEYEGLTHVRVKDWDSPFVSYAGPWAEARARWPLGPPIWEIDEDGGSFDDYVVGALMANPSDFQACIEPPTETEAAIRQEIENYLGDGIQDADAAREQIWNRELEDAWLVIESVARLLMDGTSVTPDIVGALLDAKPQCRIGHRSALRPRCSSPAGMPGPAGEGERHA